VIRHPSERELTALPGYVRSPVAALGATRCFNPFGGNSSSATNQKDQRAISTDAGRSVSGEGNKLTTDNAVQVSPSASSGGVATVTAGNKTNADNLTSSGTGNTITLNEGLSGDDLKSLLAATVTTASPAQVTAATTPPPGDGTQTTTTTDSATIFDKIKSWWAGLGDQTRSTIKVIAVAAAVFIGFRILKRTKIL
jgi:hypothetical protein